MNWQDDHCGLASGNHNKLGALIGKMTTAGLPLATKISNWGHELTG
jgi:hypothetical protein